MFYKNQINYSNINYCQKIFRVDKEKIKFAKLTLYYRPEIYRAD